MMSKEYNHVRDLFRGGQGVVQLFNHWPTHQDRAIKRSFGGLSMDLRSGKFVSALPFARYGIPVLEVLSDTEYAMPYYDYPLLAKITNANTAKRSEDLVWTCELALKLALHIYFLHDRTMAPHGDLTPSNILVGRREPNEPWWTSFLTKAASADMIALPTLLKEFDSNFATDRSVVVIDPWCFDSSYDRGVPPNF